MVKIFEECLTILGHYALKGSTFILEIYQERISSF